MAPSPKRALVPTLLLLFLGACAQEEGDTGAPPPQEDSLAGTSPPVVL